MLSGAVHVVLSWHRGLHMGCRRGKAGVFDPDWTECGKYGDFRAGGIVKTLLLLVAALMLATTGCAITRAGGRLEPIEVVPAAIKPTVECRADAPDWHLGILRLWKANGYIEDYKVSSSLTRTADYVVFVAAQKNDEYGRLMAFISAVTFTAVPFSGTEHYFVHYTLENVRTEERYSASVADSVHYKTSVLLAPATPWTEKGSGATFEAMADHLYQQLKDAGAFGPGERTDASYNAGRHPEQRRAR